MGWSNTGLSVVEANTVIISSVGSGSGIFVYDGAPAFGNLVGSWTTQAGTDAYGNPYDAGFNLNQTSGGATVASIDTSGNAVFQDLLVNGTLHVDGTDLDSLLDAKPNGIQYWGSRTSNSDTTSGSTEEAILTLGTTMVDGRMYRLATSEMRVTGSTNGDVFVMTLRDGGSSAPTTSSNLIAVSTTAINNSGSTEGQSLGLSMVLSCDNSSAIGIDNFHSGTHNFLMGFQRNSGTGTASINTGTNTSNPIQIYLEDIGPLVQNTGVNQSGGGGGTPVTQYTTTYSCNGSASYQESGNNRSVSQCYQGEFSSTNGNQWSLIGFPFATIQSDLSGATINKVELFLTNQHWYYNAGGTTIVGRSSDSPTSGSGTYSHVTSNVNSFSGWALGAAKWVTLSNSIGTAFQNGTAKSIALGKGPSTSLTYYGYFAGNGQTGEPQLRITYTK